ncbi:uncharacterized protein N0V89_009839 [Didymosphaeria variabile]|uniref:Uncharacterized protein n=1 Tax=Didymosphaeria variabile TaxID=1932322 RepID=A0A9W9C8J4_9PLEO|nr:uncharacterized protein N0V89_009839 [Didymosphaeria variabile]KAJ4348464.1 hypothetical protein N0V89_009839 [Didymosphaeria variabile]
MSLINRPFRGFSGVYTMPLPPLPSPSSTSTSLDSQRSTSTVASTDAPKPKRSLFHRSKSRASLEAAPAAEMDRPAPPSRAHTAGLPAATTAPPRSKLASLLRRHRTEQAPSPEELERELEQLYVNVYTKAERRALFREWKAREEERDRWEVEKFEDGEEWER